MRFSLLHHLKLNRTFCLFCLPDGIFLSSVYRTKHALSGYQKEHPGCAFPTSPKGFSWILNIYLYINQCQTELMVLVFMGIVVLFTCASTSKWKLSLNFDIACRSIRYFLGGFFFFFVANTLHWSSSGETFAYRLTGSLRFMLICLEDEVFARSSPAAVLVNRLRSVPPQLPSLTRYHSEQQRGEWGGRSASCVCVWTSCLRNERGRRACFRITK